MPASGLNGVLAAKEPATTAEPVPTSTPCEMRSRKLSATPASAAVARMLTSRGASGSGSGRPSPCAVETSAGRRRFEPGQEPPVSFGSGRMSMAIESPRNSGVRRT